VRRRWPKILKLGNVYVGILKPIGLVGRIAPAPVVDPFKVAEWYAEYKALVVLSYSEEQDSLDALVLHELVTTHPDTFEVSEWYAEYSTA